MDFVKDFFFNIHWNWIGMYISSIQLNKIGLLTDLRDAFFRQGTVKNLLYESI